MNMIAPTRRRLVVVGNGMAGIRALEEILARSPNAFDVTVFGAEPHGNYNRILLSPVLAGEKSFADIVTHDRGWYAERGIELIAGEAVAEIDRTAREVRGERGTLCFCWRPAPIRSSSPCRELRLMVLRPSATSPT